jgi:hypothetical protein
LVNVKTGIDKRRHRRHSRRIPCQLFIGQREHSALVLDLSVTGLFIQTNARPEIGERLRVHLAHERAPLELTVEVARSRHVPPSLLAAARGGVGVRIVSAPEEYDRLLVRLRIAEPTASEFEYESETPHFRVHVVQAGGSRSRRVEVAASDAEKASARALEEVGTGWRVLRVQAL